MSSQPHHFKVGNFDLTMFQVGGGPRKAVDFLNTAPPDELERVVREQGYDPDALMFSMNVILLKTPDQKILIDTGLPSSGLAEKLMEEGVQPEDIDLIIITHGHGDHIGGVMNAAGEPVYPNAKYVIWKTEWDFTTNEERLAQMADNPMTPLIRSWKKLEDRVTTIGGHGVEEAEIMPGIRAIATPGHTIGHVAIMLDSNGEKLLHLADAAHQFFQTACPQWSPGFDYDKEMGAKTRRNIFARAAQEGCKVMGYHFTFPQMGYVKEKGDAFTWEMAE